MGVTATGVQIPLLPPIDNETLINSLTMRFIHFLTEQMPGDTSPNHIQKREKADRQRNRNETRKRAARNKQAMRAKANGDVVNMGNQGQNFKGARPAERIAGANVAPAKKPVKPKAEVDPQLQPFLDIAGGDRAKAMEMITLLGAIYQTKRTNPAAQLSVPKLVTQSKNGKELQKLFDIVKDKDLPQLAAMSQEIKRSAATPGANAAPAGMTNTPATPGETPAQKSAVQKTIDSFKRLKNLLSPAQWKVLSKEADKNAQNAKPNPSNNTQQPQGKPIMTQG